MLDSASLEAVWGTPLQDRDPQHVLDTIFKKKLFTLAVIGTKFFCVLSFEIGPMVGEDDVLEEECK